MTQETARKIIELTRRGYETIQEPFDATRRFPWEEFSVFDSYVNPGIRVLELGCGNGRLLEWLKSSELSHYVGIDGNAYFLAQAQKSYSAPNRIFIQADLLELATVPELSGRQFDVVFCIASLHHIPSHTLREHFLKSVHPLLKPGGFFIITNWNLWRLTLREKSVWKYLSRWKKFGFTQFDIGFCDVMTQWKSGKAEAFLYYRAFTVHELRRILRDTDFTVIDSYYNTRGVRTHWWNARNLITIARK